MPVVTQHDVQGLFTNCLSKYFNILECYPKVVEIYLSQNPGTPLILGMLYQKQYQVRLDDNWIRRIITLYSSAVGVDIKTPFVLMDNTFGDLLFWLSNQLELKDRWSIIRS